MTTINCTNKRNQKYSRKEKER